MPFVCNPYEQFLRRRLSEAQNHRCCYCGTRMTRRTVTLEHVQARTHGGRSTFENCVAACYSCNTERGIQRPFRFWYEKQRTISKMENVARLRA